MAMTIDEFLLDTYIGARVALIVREAKHTKDGMVYQENAWLKKDNQMLLINKWKLIHREYPTKHDIYLKDKMVEDKIVNIKKRYTYWRFTTLQGYIFDVRTHTKITLLNG